MTRSPMWLIGHSTHALRTRAAWGWGGFLILALSLLLFLACSQREAPIREEPTKVLSSQERISWGEQLYTANCLSCHGGATGGSMMDIPPSHNSNGHTWHHPDCQLVQTVLNGSGEMGEMMRRMMDAPEGTPRMPAFKGTLTEGEIMAILSYIKTWWIEEQRRSQARVSEQSC